MGVICAGEQSLAIMRADIAWCVELQQADAGPGRSEMAQLFIDTAELDSGACRELGAMHLIPQQLSHLHGHARDGRDAAEESWRNRHVQSLLHLRDDKQRSERVTAQRRE